MAKSCDICGRGPQVVIRRSHAMNKTRAKHRPNIQNRRTSEGKKRVCTKCIKSDAFQR